MAQRGDLVRAKALVRVRRAFGPKEAVACARCVVAAVTRGSSWPKDALGGAVSAPERFIKSIPKKGPLFAPSSSTAWSPGSTASSGTAPVKATRAI
jgi:hypothetical protein